MEVMKLSFVLIIILGGLYFLMRFLKNKIVPQKGLIELISFHPLGPKRGICIVKVLNGYLVLGVGDENISFIDRLDPKEVEEAIQDTGSNIRYQDGKSGGSGFRDLFKSKLLFWLPACIFSVLSFFFSPDLSFAAPAVPPSGGGILGMNSPLELLLFLTLLSFLPAILVMCTCFTRIIVVLSFLKQAMGTPQAPPNTVLVGLALFITFFVMSPVVDRIYADAYLPYTKKEIGAEDALTKASVPLKEFMLKQTREKDLALFLKVSKSERPATPMDLPMKVVVPAFAIGELQKAFEIGFLIYLPFLVIDMIVGSILLAMGMMMLPPVMVSLPVKLLLFVLADGWELIISSLIGGFR